jgi:hypothetical protein
MHDVPRSYEWLSQKGAQKASLCRKPIDMKCSETSKQRKLMYCDRMLVVTHLKYCMEPDVGS